MTHKSPLNCPKEYTYIELQDAFDALLNRYERIDKRTKEGKEKAAQYEKDLNTLRPHISASLIDKTYRQG